MDVAYDAIQESSLPSAKPSESTESDIVISAELHQAYQNFSSSSWAKGFTSFFGTVKKQGEGLYEGVTKEVNEVGKEAASEFGTIKEGILGRVRGLSVVGNSAPGIPSVPDESAVPNAVNLPQEAQGEGVLAQPVDETEASIDPSKLISRFRSEASRRLVEIQRAEDAADAALARLGSNIASFLKEAVTISPSSTDGENTVKSQLLFESKDPNSGRRLIHTTRLDAQLHLLHTNSTTFTQDPDNSYQWKTWNGSFDVEGRTDQITKDLDDYPELRRTLEKLTGPSATEEGATKVEYADFWRRYYFVRGVVENEDHKRREMVKQASSRSATRADDEDIGWGEESEDESTAPNHSPRARPADPTTSTQETSSPTALLHPDSAIRGRKSDEERERANSVISDESYDVVSGAPSTARASPKLGTKDPKKGEESDDDWE